jgi:hypothetical protein
MKLQTSIGELIVKFRHENPIGTHCVLEGGSWKTSGDSRCSPKDHFCRETGRKVSLAKALNPLPKTVRKEVWDAYLNRPKPCGLPRVMTSPDVHVGEHTFLDLNTKL